MNTFEEISAMSDKLIKICGFLYLNLYDIQRKLRLEISPIRIPKKDRRSFVSSEDDVDTVKKIGHVIESLTIFSKTSAKAGGVGF
ncbi:hypothetical protein CaldiYA01_16570 [Caldicellulosiruptor diazotrophicus]|uniref:Uncharacterized protein n=1 Tax=Caldicellulosiruptor diazotrophicus TaxID=2806205 RepID=A0ABN6E871_9FIRM|nr:hypothetical protein CaldiYA01_16570 [Caldicellulosiruptor diazotrophicus]